MRWIFASLLISANLALAQGADYQSRLAAFRETIQHEIGAGNISGVSVALVEGNRIVYVDGFGFANKKKRIPATRDTVYRAGSISKLFTALATMQLTEQKKLSIDQPVAELWHDFRPVNPFPDAKPITLRQLMCHRAGMFRECPVGSYFDPFEPGLRPTVRSIDGCVLVYPPETQTKYSNIGVAIVGQTVATVSGLPFHDYARELLFRPMGMEHSSFVRTREIRDQLATGYMLIADGRGGFREIEAPILNLAPFRPAIFTPPPKTLPFFCASSSPAGAPAKRRSCALKHSPKCGPRN